MKRVRWALFIAAGVCLFGSLVMWRAGQQSERKAFGMIADAVTRARADFTAEYPRPSSAERGEDTADPSSSLYMWRIWRSLDSDAAEQAVQQSQEYIALERRQEWTFNGYIFGVIVGGFLSIIWAGTFIIPFVLRPTPRLLRSIGIAYHKTAVTTVRGSIRSSRAVRKHVRDIVDEATEDEA